MIKLNNEDYIIPTDRDTDNNDTIIDNDNGQNIDVDFSELERRFNTQISRVSNNEIHFEVDRFLDETEISKDVIKSNIDDYISNQNEFTVTDDDYLSIYDNEDSRYYVVLKYVPLSTLNELTEDYASRRDYMNGRYTTGHSRDSRTRYVNGGYSSSTPKRKSTATATKPAVKHLNARVKNSGSMKDAVDDDSMSNVDVEENNFTNDGEKIFCILRVSNIDNKSSFRNFMNSKVIKTAEDLTKVLLNYKSNNRDTLFSMVDLKHGFNRKDLESILTTIKETMETTNKNYYAEWLNQLGSNYFVIVKL